MIALSFDDRLLDTTALRYIPRVLSEADNGYLVLAKAADRLGKPEDLNGERFSDALYGRSWDSARVEGWLKDREFALATVRKTRALQFGQKPVPEDIAAAYGPQSAVHMPIQLAVIRARLFLHEGDTAAAASLVCDALHAVRIVQDSRGDDLTYMYSIGAHLVAIEAAYAVISDPRTTVTDCRRLGDEITRSRSSREEFTQMMAADFRIKVLLAEALTHPQSLPRDWKLSRKDSIGYRLPFLYKPNQSLNYIIPWFSYYESLLDLPFEEKRTQWTWRASQLPDLCEMHGDWLNAYGKRAAHDLLYPALGGMINARLRQQTRCSIGEALVALRRYHAANSGQLPASLDELVPAYLSSVPLDYADGLPIKYSREMKALWSVGENQFSPTEEGKPVDAKALIVPVRFGGDYVLWPRLDPDQPSEESSGAFGHSR